MSIIFLLVLCNLLMSRILENCPERNCCCSGAHFN
ncbi:hypothetical protein GLYMA_16G089550v4 [Glycine max]|nr:hypothetical protein GLYMA_16G089550v4 [Glycine max]KAH1150598.1 hypothetical protein GYH30_044564 [Glycine max]